MKTIKSLIILSLVLMLGGQMMGQKTTHGSMFLSAAFPVGDYADGDKMQDIALGGLDDEGGAGIGGNIGFKWNFGVGVPGLGVMLSLDGFFNGPNGDMKDYYKTVANEWEVGFNNVTVRSPKYFNVPVMLGVHYCYDFNPQFGIYAEAGAGGDLRLITNYTQQGLSKIGNLKEKLVNHYSPAFSFAYQVGVGIEVSKSLVIGCSFYDLGGADVKVDKSWVHEGNTETTVSETLGRVHPMMILARIGFAF